MAKWLKLATLGLFLAVLSGCGESKPAQGTGAEKTGSSKKGMMEDGGMRKVGNPQ